jgi:hypothetical protein
MCERVVDCSLAEAKEQMTPEDYADLESKMDQIRPKAIGECEPGYATASPRQVVGIRACLGEATECPVYLDCISNALKPAAEEAGEGEAAP